MGDGGWVGAERSGADHLGSGMLLNRYLVTRCSVMGLEHIKGLETQVGGSCSVSEGEQCRAGDQASFAPCPHLIV